MQQVVITLNVLLISRTKNAHSDHALLVVFFNLKAGFKGGMHVSRWVGGGKMNLFKYSHAVFSSLNLTVIIIIIIINLTVIRIAELQADKQYFIFLERADIAFLVAMHHLQQSINSFRTFFTRLSILLYC